MLRPVSHNHLVQRALFLGVGVLLAGLWLVSSGGAFAQSWIVPPLGSAGFERARILARIYGQAQNLHVRVLPRADNRSILEELGKINGAIAIADASIMTLLDGRRPAPPGSQGLRLVLTRRPDRYFSLFMKQTTVQEELRNKHIATIEGSEFLADTIYAFLTAVHLAPSDIVLSPFATPGEAWQAFVAGKVDVIPSISDSPYLAWAARVGLTVRAIPIGNDADRERARAIAPWLLERPPKEEKAAPSEPSALEIVEKKADAEEGFAWTGLVLLTRADSRHDEEVRALLDFLLENPNAPKGWVLRKGGVERILPWHDEAIRLFRKRNTWLDMDEQKHERLLHRRRILIDSWAAQETVPASEQTTENWSQTRDMALKAADLVLPAPVMALPLAP